MITLHVTRPALGPLFHYSYSNMVRLLALVVVALFATSNALVPTSEQQQLVTSQGSPVHATEGWSWDDCGQSYLGRRLYHAFTHPSSPPFKGSPSDPIQIDSITVSPDPPKPGQDLTVTVKAHAQDRVEVCLRTPLCLFVLLINGSLFRMGRTPMFR